MEHMSERQIKDKIRYLADKMEKLYDEVYPVLEEFELTKQELDNILKYVEENNVNSKTEST